MVESVIIMLLLSDYDIKYQRTGQTSHNSQHKLHSMRCWHVKLLVRPYAFDASILLFNKSRAVTGKPREAV